MKYYLFALFFVIVVSCREDEEISTTCYYSGYPNRIVSVLNVPSMIKPGDTILASRNTKIWKYDPDRITPGFYNDTLFSNNRDTLSITRYETALFIHK
jgi:hypothetical protein